MCKYQQTNYECGSHVEGYIFLGSCVRVANARLESEKARAAAAAAALAANETAAENKGKAAEDDSATNTAETASKATNAVLNGLSKTATIRKGKFWSPRKTKDAAADAAADTEGMTDPTGLDSLEEIKRCDPKDERSGATIRQIRDYGGRCPVCAIEELGFNDTEAVGLLEVQLF